MDKVFICIGIFVMMVSEGFEVGCVKFVVDVVFWFFGVLIGLDVVIDEFF